MPRQTVIGNGRLAAAFDANMSIRDLYYPRVGLENHLSGHEIRMGVFAEGKFRWLHDGWETDLRYMPETLVSRGRARHRELEVFIETNDGVHRGLDAVLRKVTVFNEGSRAREVRIFFAHDFHIYGYPEGDTVMHMPEGCMLHYKRRRYFLVNGVTSGGRGIAQFAAGQKELPGLAGTWKDAEDGVLSNNPIAHGSVDSAVSFDLDLDQGASTIIYYWIACARSLEEALALDARIRQAGVEQLLLETENYWSAWVGKKDVDTTPLPKEIVRAYKTSLLLIRSQIDDSGGIVASLDSDMLQSDRDTYAYVWPRDAAIAAMALDAAGFQDVSRLFFGFCSSAATDHGYFYHKYYADGSLGSTWLTPAGDKGRIELPIQEDETALVLYALWRHFEKYRDIEFIEGVYDNLVVKPSRFLMDYMDPETGLVKPSYDLWEERTGSFTWTASTVYAALVAAARFSLVFFDRERHEALREVASGLKAAIIDRLYDPEKGRFIRGITADGSRDTALDASASAVFMYGVLGAGDGKVEETMRAVREGLWIERGAGGVARYEGDLYRRVSGDVTGNPWLPCTLWVARWEIARARSLDDLRLGLQILRWAAARALPSGVMAEQIDPFTGDPVSVAPLIWSHAEFVLSVREYLQRLEILSAGTVGGG